MFKIAQRCPVFKFLIFNLIMYNDCLVTSDMSHVTSLHEKIQTSKFSWSGLFKLNTKRHEPLCTGFRHRRVHSMSRTVRRAVAKELNGKIIIMWPMTTKPGKSQQNCFWVTGQYNMLQINRNQRNFYQVILLFQE